MLLPPPGTSRNQQAQLGQVVVQRVCQGAVKREICRIFEWNEALFKSQSSERTTRKQRAVRGCMPDYGCILILRFASVVCIRAFVCIQSVVF